MLHLSAYYGYVAFYKINAVYKWSHVWMFFLSPSSTFARFSGTQIKHPIIPEKYFQKYPSDPLWPVLPLSNRLQRQEPLSQRSIK
jgi:hypothetical protein